MNDKTYRYFETLYKVIPTALAKAFFGIELGKNDVFYKNKYKDDINERLFYRKV